MSGLLLGLDLGTTSLAGRLWDGRGQQLAEASLANPQQKFGSDVIQRLEAARAGAGEQLQQLLVDGINLLLGQLLTQVAGTAESITAAAAAANPPISHLLAGEPVARILFPPHRPDFLAGGGLDSQKLGLQLPVPLYLLPLVRGYVGGDLLAVLLAQPPEAGPTLYLDLGTNAELALWDGHNWLATSVAAGPAFEAGNLGCGMLHAPGAVTEVRVVDDRLALNVAGGGVPKGVCGSGFFSAIGAAVSAGLISRDGRIRAVEEVDSNLARYLVFAEAGGSLQLYRDARSCLQISQADLRAFQLAKGAVRAGVSCLLKRAGLAAEQLQAVWIAGALGAALPATALKGVAMLPENVLEKCRFLPDAVLDGIIALLLQEDGFSQLQRLAAQVKAYPLSGTPAFENAFLASLDFS